MSQPLPPPDTASLPGPLGTRVAAAWERLAAAAAAAGVTLPRDQDWLSSLPRVFAASDFVVREALRAPEVLAGLVRDREIHFPDSEGALARRAAEALAGVEDEAGLARALRALRRREMLRIAWRDLAGWAPLQETLNDLSLLAEVCLDHALAALDGWLERVHGPPLGVSGQRQHLVVLGMGKLGARELNFSSDIDLIFAYPEGGETAGPRVLSNAEYFARLGQALIRAMDQVTADGFVFRVDMRLRPFGQSGPLAASFDGMEQYYQAQGRDWERYALIKARPVAGDRAAGDRLLQILAPFVYRRYLDYGAFDALREMKALIDREMRLRGRERDIKLGPGGIREIEFIAQTFQLVRGGREPRLQRRELLRVLETLGDLGLLDPAAVADLADAYRLLRRVENHLQAMDDRQTHALPADPESRLRLAWGLGHESWETLAAEIDAARARVQEVYGSLFSAPGEAEGATCTEALWRGTLGQEPALACLRERGLADPERGLELLVALRDGARVRAMGARGRGHLGRLIPAVLERLRDCTRPDDCLQRVLGVIENIVGRSAYLALLVENPGALDQLLRLCDASPWIAGLLGRHPVLLDELLDPRALTLPLDREALRRQLRREMASIPADDLERRMDALRRFRQAQVLRVAAADVARIYPLMVVSDHLTAIAEVVLEEVLAMAWNDLVARHGAPHCIDGGTLRPAGLGIVAYGKLGGIELGYGSDLDLVFLHDSRGEARHTDGERPVDNAVFFARLGQRIIHILSTHTPAGILYEVDMRLRPSGASGLLVSSIDAFAAYQREQAWTWEHQALVRARPVAGEARLAEAFRAIREEVLTRPRDEDALRREVADMRRRMREQLADRDPAHFDLKQGAGGIADIEFLVQFAVLAHAARAPALIEFTDNIRQLRALADHDVLDRERAARLADIYRSYRARVHALTLQELPAVVAAGEYRAEREFVTTLWRQWMQPEG